MHLVVAVDGSEESERALLHAADLTAAIDGRLTAVHAVAPAVRDRGGTGPFAGLAEAEGRLLTEPIEDAEARGERVLENAAAIVDGEGVDLETELLYGEPVETIAGFLESEPVDGLVVGHRGLSEHAEQRMGSVAKDMLGHSPVPVTVVG